VPDLPDYRYKFTNSKPYSIEPTSVCNVSSDHQHPEPSALSRLAQASGGLSAHISLNRRRTASVEYIHPNVYTYLYLPM
jgi:hypothetical protein